MPTLVFATSNAGKLKELRALLGEGWAVKSAAELPHVPEVVEDRDTFEGNAEKKARALAQATGHLALADDSGLCVDALNGAPGVFSARYAADDDARITKLLEALKDTPDALRTARFVCVLCVAMPDGPVQFARGECHGRIARERRGAHGFGYDPIFELPTGRTLAELTLEEKATVSHRGNAFALMQKILHSLR